MLAHEVDFEAWKRGLQQWGFVADLSPTKKEEGERKEKKETWSFLNIHTITTMKREMTHIWTFTHNSFLTSRGTGTSQPEEITYLVGTRPDMTSPSPKPKQVTKRGTKNFDPRSEKKLAIQEADGGSGPWKELSRKNNSRLTRSLETPMKTYTVLKITIRTKFLSKNIQQQGLAPALDAHF